MQRSIIPLATLMATLLSLQTQAGVVTFIHNNDLHAHLTPHLDKVEKDGHIVYESRGGIARLATLVKTIRTENPASVFMNIGDTFHGGAEALFTNGNAIAAAVNALGIDVGVPGNWDFAYGPSVMRLRYATLTAAETRLLEAAAGMSISRTNFPNLAANMAYTTPVTKAGQLVLPATLLKKVGDVQIGFIGITSDIVAEMDSKLATGLAFTQGETGYRDLINTQAQTLRSQGAQLVVVMSELGLHKDARLADIINTGAVDVFFSAHTHEAVFKPLIGRSGARVVEAGNDGWLGRMDVSVENGVPSTFQWTLLPVDAAVPEDAAMLATVATARAPFLIVDPNVSVPTTGVNLTLHQPLTAVVGQIQTPLDRKSALDSSFNSAWTDSVRAYAGTQLALSPGFRFDAPVAALGTQYEDGYVADGNVTIEDVYRFFPVPFTLATGTVTGARLKEILEGNLSSVYSLNSFAQHGGWTEGWSGLNASIDLTHSDGQRVVSLALSDSGSLIQDTDTITVAGCQRPNETVTDALCSNPGFSNIAALTDPLTGSAWYPQNLLIKALNEAWFADGTRRSFLDQAATPSWPEQPFVQPLAVRVTSGVSMSKSGLVYNRSSKTYTGQITVTNTGTVALTAPLKLVIEGLSSGVTVSNANGSYYAQPYLSVPGTLTPGAQIRVQISLQSSAKNTFTYTPTAYTGGI